MIIYKDILSGDEMFSDSYKLEKKDDTFWYIKGKLVQVGGDDIDDSLIGGNKSAEATDDDLAGGDPNKETKIDVVHANRLVETGFANKKVFGGYLKKFLTVIKERLFESKKLDKDDQAAVDAWQANISAMVKKHILAEFSDLQFFMGESCNGDGAILACKYEGETPYLFVLCDAVEGEKV